MQKSIEIKMSVINKNAISNGKSTASQTVKRKRERKRKWEWEWEQEGQTRRAPTSRKPLSLSKKKKCYFPAKFTTQFAVIKFFLSLSLALSPSHILWVRLIMFGLLI